MTINRLFIAEKPDAGRQIARHLGLQKDAGYYTDGSTAVTWAVGHLLEMAPPDVYGDQYATWDLASLPILPETFRYDVTARGRKQYALVKKLLDQAKQVVIATDVDKEGEVIAREIIERCRYRGPVKRLWITALDPRGLRQAMDNILDGSTTEPLYAAGLGRARADWVVGMNLTRAFTVLGRDAGYNGLLSVGRVQTPTLNLVVRRDREIEAFEPHDYYTVTITCAAGKESPFVANWVPGSNDGLDDDGRCTNRQAADTVAQQVLNQTFEVTGAVFEDKEQPPPLPYDLSTLLSEAEKKLKLDSSDVQQIAQSLYEDHHATTYPRTESAYLPQSIYDERAETLAAVAKSDPGFAPLVAQADQDLTSRAWTSNDSPKVAPHHAIIPTSTPCDVGQMNESERAVYDLIRRRYLAQFFPNHQYQAGRLEVAAEKHKFVATGRHTTSAGWRTVIAPDDGDDEQDSSSSLPQLSPGATGSVIEAIPKTQTTRPKARYTKGTLITAMKRIGSEVEDKKLRQVLNNTTGIGTTATRTSIIDELVKKGLLVKRKNYLVSSQAGRALVDVLPQAVKDPAMTALWEQALDQIARGEAKFDAFLRQQYQWVRQLIEYLQHTPIDLSPLKSLVQPCLKCTDGALARRKGAHGFFWACNSCDSTFDDRAGRPVERSAGARGKKTSRKRRRATTKTA